LSWQNWLNSPGDAPPVVSVGCVVPWVVVVGVAPPVVLLGVLVVGWVVVGGVVAGCVVVGAGVVVVVVGVAPADEVDVPPAVVAVGAADVVVPVAAPAAVEVWGDDEALVAVVEAAGASVSAPAGTVSGGAPGGMRSADCRLWPQPEAATASTTSPAARARGMRDGMGRA